MPWAPDYVTVEELGNYTRIDDTVDDATLSVAIAAASRAIDRHVGRQFGNVTPEEARIYPARPDHRGGFWVVDVDDFHTDVGLSVLVDEVNIVTEFVKEPQNAAPKGRPWTRIRFTADSEFYPTKSPHEVTVTARYGWADIPDAIRKATLLQSTRLFSRRVSPFGVAGSPELGSELRLLNQVDPDVAVSLRDFRRIRSLA